MKKEIEDILDGLVSEGNSASSTVADHIRIVAGNGPEYSTDEAIAEEASALVGAAMQLDTTLLDAVAQAKAALVGDSNDAEHDALVAIMKALGEGRTPECKCNGPELTGKHQIGCPAKAWEKKF